MAPDHVVFIGSNRRLTHQILHHLVKLRPVVCADAGTPPPPATIPATRASAGGGRPLVAVVTWADVLRGGGSAPIIARVLDLKRRTGNTGPVTICAVPYAAFLSTGGGTHVWLRSNARHEPGAEGLSDPVEAAAAECRRAGMAARIVAAPMLLIPRVHEINEYPSFINKVLGVARCLAREALDKAPAYVDHYPLRLNVAAAAIPNMITPSTLARWLADTPPCAAEGQEIQSIAVQCPAPWSMCIDAVRASCGFALSVADAPAAGTALDRLFNELVFDHHGARCEQYNCAPTACDAGVDPDDRPATIHDLCSAPPVRWESTYRSAHEYDLGTLMTRHVPSAALAGHVHARTEACGAYYDGGGDGPAVLMLAPVGIDPGYFGNLAAELMFDHRVVVWVEAESDDSGSARAQERSASQAAAVRRVLEDAGIRSCHIVAWCVGVQVADALVRECPSLVDSVALFSPDIGGDREPTREYKSLLDLFTLIARNPGNAPTILARAKGIIRMSAAGDVEQYRSGTRVSPLQYRSAALARRAVRVFDDPAHVVRWARQFLDMVQQSGACGAALRGYAGPVLSILGTHDSLLEYTALTKRCAAFTRGTIATVRGGNHYVVTEHAPVVGELLRQFMREGSLSTAASLIDAGRVLVEPARQCS